METTDHDILKDFLGTAQPASLFSLPNS